MGSGIFYPVVGGDDGFIYGTSFSATTDHLTMGDAGDSRSIFVRFVNVTIPQGSLITSAFVRLRAYTSDAEISAHFNLYFNATGNAVAPTSYSEYNNLLKTSAVAWNNVAAWSTAVKYDTPSLVNNLQEVVDRSDFASGNAVMALFCNNGSDANAHRAASAIEHGTTEVELHVEWDLAAKDETATWNPEDKGENITFSTDLLTATHA